MNIFKLVGNTPLIEINGIYIKLEMFNPSGSVKDRAVMEIIKESIRQKEFDKVNTIIECSSGNTGISAAMFAAYFKKECIIFLPIGTSKNKIKMIEKYGARIAYTANIDSGLEMVEREIHRTNSKCLYLRQFENEANAIGQMQIAYEILKCSDEDINLCIDKLDCIVLGTGTGGSLKGIYDVIKHRNEKCKFYQVLPLVGKIEGLADGVKTPLLDKLDIETIFVTSDDAKNTSEMLSKKYGLNVGISSGANFLAAKILSQNGKKVLTIFPDSGDRYL
jgi:cysteine synthase A